MNNHLIISNASQSPLVWIKVCGVFTRRERHRDSSEAIPGTGHVARDQRLRALASNHSSSLTPNPKNPGAYRRLTIQALFFLIRLK